MKKRPFQTCLAPLPLAAAAWTFLAMNGQCANPAYPSVVEADGALGYFRFNDTTARDLIHVNSGSLGAAGNAVNDPLYYSSGGVLTTNATGVVHSFPGAIAGDRDRSEFFDFTTRTEIPFNSAFNTPNTQPFTVEAWLYPASDQTGTGQSPICNRYTVGANRQGWVYFQRRPDGNYKPGDSGLGWNFRIYNGVGSSSPLDTQTAVPYQVGKWQHVVTVFDPVSAYNATVIMYVDGLPVVTNTYNDTTLTTPCYAPCTGDHDPAEAVSGQPNLSIGCYNNANTGLNPYYGAVDEFAWYGTKLSAEQILAHYQNATNANRTVPYSVLVKSDNPVVYLRLDEIAPGPGTAVNLGNLRAAGAGTHTAEVRHPAAGPVKSDKTSGATAYHNRNGNSATTLPYSPQNNGDQAFLANPNPNPGTGWAGTPFTFETWLRPMRDQQGGQCPVNNRSVGGTGRTGWVIFQRFPNNSYANVPGINNEGHGWNFRMYSGNGSGGQDILTDTDYTIGSWQHLVVTWEPQVDNGDVVGNGNDQWQGILTAYVDGQAVATNDNILYAANLLVPESGVNPNVNGAPADLAIGSYNAASGLGSNPFEGDVGELAIYNGYVLTPDQILAHYQAGTNSTYGTNYTVMVMTAAAEAQQAANTIVERTTLPTTYLRLNDSANYAATNSGSLGHLADGDLSLTTNNAAGPQAPAYAGFEANNTALPLDGVKQWASFNNPAGLEISGQITLEAWVQPSAIQGDPARIISHGPPTTTDYLNATAEPDGAVTNSTEVFLRIDGGGANYVVGSTTIIYTNNTDYSSNFYGATFAIPAGDLGSGNWIHLAGTYDGTKWNLYRNGALVASAAGAVGALPVLNGDWAIGSTGNGWANNYAGGVDEVAIYNKALSAAIVLNHYNVGKNGAVTTLNFNPPVLSNGQLTISWTGTGTLLQSTNVTLPMSQWTAVPGNPSSQYTITPATNGPQTYYRLRQ